MNRQVQQQKQQQKLTPQQIMLMKFLQMPVTDLEQSIKDEIEKNPLLEEKETHEDPLPNIQEDYDNEEDELYEDEDYRYRERLEYDKNNDTHSPIISADDSSAEYLLDQLNFKNISERQMTICHEIIGSLDDNGYLCRSLDLISNDMAFRQGIDCSLQEIEDALLTIQSLEPAGVGARSLQECLSIQLHRDEDDDESKQDAITIIDSFFDIFSKRHFDKLAERTGWDEQRLDNAINRIRRLNPKPSPTVSDSLHRPQYIQPDFIVNQQEGGIVITPNDKNFPELQLNGYYQELLHDIQSNRNRNKDEQSTLQFLKNKTEEAQNFMEMLKQRHITLWDIVEFIVKKQATFFLSGNPADLLPLQQKDVAEATGYDTSTISRVVNSKYLQTDFGTIALKECFSKSITNEEGDSIGIEHIKSALRHIVQSEDKASPLTDDELTKALNQQGFPLARRTVAKYREMLGIPVRRLRRELKCILLLAFSLSCMTLWAQKPSYYDSIIQAQLKKEVPKKNKKPIASKKQNLPMDSTILKGDELIDIIYDSCTPNCARLWYGNHFSSYRVREYSLPIDSLPDEINIKLIQKEEEFCFPVKNIITSPYGWRWERPHRGVDIRLNVGCPVHCAFAGIVRIARPMGAYGNLVVVRHYNGLETVYGHLSKINVKPQQEVKAGDVIGLGGSTGRSTGPHLHFEVRFQYETFDPEWILDFSNFTLRTRRLHLDKTYFGVTKPRKHENLTYKADKSFVKEKPAAPKERYYVAQEGDYKELIAIKFGISVEKLKELNPDVKKVKKGMRLRVR